MKKQARQGLFLLIVFAALVSCGIKGPPLPPITEETIQKDKLTAEEAQATSNTTSAPTSTDPTIKKKNEKK